ncbi:MAG TPA: TonB-dependent receptor [Pyrinomonadaceae bacterium]|jgi:outer membrane receptor protein involved in Fe transport
MYRKTVLTLAAMLLLSALAVPSLGQVTGGAVAGSVVDAQGAVVPNATVTLLNKATGQTLTTQTTDTGAFNFPNVALGEYTITIENTGFAPVTQELKVSLNQTATVNATLQAGQVTGTVNVTAASEALVQTENSQLTRSFETKQVQDLPIFGNQNQLAVLAPNVVERSAGVTGSGGSVGGTRPRGNSFVIDGVDNNDASTTGPVVGVIQDAVAEFTLISNNFNAEFGDVAGGQFNTVTKSGTNEFHGSGYIYQQSERFNAATTGQKELLNTPLDQGGLLRKPRYRDQRTGLTGGGPIITNKLFFFSAFERQKNVSAGTVASYAAPTPAGLDLIATLPGASAYVVNFLRQNLTLAPAALFNQSVLGTDVPFGSVSVLAPTGFINHQLQVNIDHTPNTNDQFRYRFNFQRVRAEQQGGQLGTADPRFNNFLAFNASLFSANWVHSFGPSVVNDLRLAYRRSRTNYPLKDAQYNAFPNITDLETGIDLGPGANLPQGTPVDNNYQIFDTVNYTRGAHTFKFGGEYRNLIFTSAFLPRARGDYIYLGFEELITDAAPSFTNLRGVGSQFFSGNQQSFYAFGQDDWKVRPNLTFNLGLRYEFVTIPRDAKLQALNSIADVPGVITFAEPKSDKNNFAPRVGLAYSPNASSSIGRFLFGTAGQSAIRANVAISYYANFQNLPLLALPPQVQTELNLPSAAAAFGFDPARPFLQNGGLPGTLPPTTTAAAARRITQARIPDQINPYSISWAVSYQRELSATTAIELRYLATRGRHLPVQIRLNAGVVPANIGLPTFFSQPTAAQLAGLTKTLGDINALRQTMLGPYGFLGSVTEHSPVGNSQYDSGSVSLTRRFSRGLAFTSAYTWSKTIDDSTNELNTSAVNPRRSQDAFDLRNERGLSALDIPHRFVMSVNYEVPYLLKYDNKWARLFFGGFQLAGIFQAQSGQPLTPLSGNDANRNGDTAGDRTLFNPNGVEGTGSTVHAIDATGATVAFGSNATVGYVVDNPTAQYIQAGNGVIATAGRNTMRSRGFNRTDMTILKNFRFAERYTLQVGAEIYDLFNQKARTLGNGGLQATSSGVEADPSFATVSSPRFNDYSLGDFPGRSIQLRAKFIF